MPQRNRNRNRRLVVVVGFLCCSLVFGFLMLNKYQARRQPPLATPPSTEFAATRIVTLFFAVPDGMGLARESREVDSCSDQSECIKGVITELVKGPLGELEPTLPGQTVVNGVFVADGIATVDLGHEFVEGLPGGSSSEMTAAYSIVNSIVSNFPGISAVKLLIDGKETATLKGNLDLRRALVPDFHMEVSSPDPLAGTPGPARPDVRGTPPKEHGK